MTKPKEEAKDDLSHFSKYWGAMFECGDFEALLNDIQDLLKRQSKRHKEEIERYRNLLNYCEHESKCGEDNPDKNCICGLTKTITALSHPLSSNDQKE